MNERVSVPLGSAGSLTISLKEVKLFDLGSKDREFVFGLIDVVRDYAKHNGVQLQPDETTTEPAETAARKPEAPAPAASSGQKPEGVKVPTQQLVLKAFDELGRPASNAELVQKLGKAGHAVTGKSIANALFLLKGKGLVRKAGGRWQRHDLREDASAAKGDHTFRTITKGGKQPPNPPPPPQSVASPPKPPPGPGGTEPGPAAANHPQEQPEAEKHRENAGESEDDENGEGLPQTALQALLGDMRKQKEQREKPTNISDHSPQWRAEVDRERRQKEKERLEVRFGYLADLLPKSEHIRCEWHAGCQDMAHRILPSYAGGRLVEQMSLCRYHVLLRLEVDRLPRARAIEFANSMAAAQ